MRGQWSERWMERGTESKRHRESERENEIQKQIDTCQRERLESRGGQRQRER